MRRAVLFAVVSACTTANDDSAFPTNEDVDSVIAPLPIEGQCEPSELSCNPGCPASPVVLDLAGDGFRMTDVTNGVVYDLNGDGTRETLSWTAPGSDDGWLALDRNANGIIDDGTELFGNFTEQPDPPPDGARNGYAALALLDADGDGVISLQDPKFRQLQLWQDKNHNGMSEPDELTTLAAWGIEALGTDYRVHRKTDEHGNLFRFSARVYRTPRSNVGARSYDVFLVTNDPAESELSFSAGFEEVNLFAVARAQSICARCGVGCYCKGPSPACTGERKNGTGSGTTEPRACTAARNNCRSMCPTACTDTTFTNCLCESTAKPSEAR